MLQVTLMANMVLHCPDESPELLVIQVMMPDATGNPAPVEFCKSNRERSEPMSKTHIIDTMNTAVRTNPNELFVRDHQGLYHCMSFPSFIVNPGKGVTVRQPLYVSRISLK